MRYTTSGKQLSVRVMGLVLCAACAVGTIGTVPAFAQATNVEETDEYAVNYTQDYVEPGAEEETAEVVDPISVSYETHVESIGWMDTVYDGEMSGTQGEELQVEAIRIRLENLKDPEGNPISGGIRYSVHCQGYGWLDEANDGLMTGSVGQYRRLEAIKIHLTGEAAEYYNVEYRVHCETLGTLPWVSNGEVAGTEGEELRMESIEIRLVEK